MTKKKRARSDSFSTEGEMMRASPPEPPDHVEIPEKAMPHWWAIVRAREYNSWTGTDLEHAANLACCLHDCERLRREIRVEGDVLNNQRGTPIVNPKHTLLEQLSRRSVALSRLIHVHAEATSGKARDEAERNKKQRQVSEETPSKNGSLIAEPVH